MTNNQQLLVISDTHGSTSSIFAILEHHTTLTAIFHCGDSELEHTDPVLEGIHIVRGNCDGDHNFPHELIVQVDSHVIYITHGHLYGVKSSLKRLAEQARHHNATVALYGHTHIASVDKIEGVVCVNPGSITYPRGAIGSSYCIVTLDALGIKVAHYDLQHAQILTELS